MFYFYPNQKKKKGADGISLSDPMTINYNNNR